MESLRENTEEKYIPWLISRLSNSVSSHCFSILLSGSVIGGSAIADATKNEAHAFAQYAPCALTWPWVGPCLILIWGVTFILSAWILYNLPDTAPTGDVHVWWAEKPKRRPFNQYVCEYSLDTNGRTTFENKSFQATSWVWACRMLKQSLIYSFKIKKLGNAQCFQIPRDWTELPQDCQDIHPYR